MSDKPSYDGDIPWDKMSKGAVNFTASLKGIGSTVLTLATGILAIILSVGSMSKSNNNNDLILNLTKSNTRLVEENKDLTAEITRAKIQIEIVQKELDMKDGRIAELELREKKLLARIEELEKQLKKS